MREAVLPSFYTSMTFKEKVKQVVEEVLLEKPSIFLIDLTVTDSFKINLPGIMSQLKIGRASCRERVSSPV